MSLTTKEHLNIVTAIFKNLLSFKADKSEVATKIDKSEIPDALEFIAKMELISAPVVADDGSIYTDENGVIYTL